MLKRIWKKVKSLNLRDILSKGDESVLDEDGRPHIERVKPLIFALGPRAYYGIGEFLGFTQAT